MKDDYRRTAADFMKDALTLHESGRPRNACYLAGYVVESTIKAMLESSGKKPAHIHDLIPLGDQLAELALTAGQRAAKYGNPRDLAPTITRRLDAPQSAPSPSKSLCDWDPRHRYDGSRWASAEKSSAYVKEAQMALEVLNKLILDGGFRHGRF